MAKSGFWLRGAKGKLAGTTIYKGKVGTTMREIVTPANPKSEKQMLQRSLFVAAVKFYKHANQSFFPFAFEGKKSTWSEFNAFMNANSQVGIRLAPKAANCSTYPAMGNYVMTDGSLGIIPSSWNTEDTQFEVGVTTPTGVALTTIGALSTSLLAKYENLRAGDIITLVCISATEQYEYNELEPEAGNPIVWELKQFIIDAESTDTIASVLNFTRMTPSLVENTLVMTPNEGATDLAMAFNICASRVSSDGTKVSRSVLCNNSIAKAAITAGNQEGWIQQVLTAWSAANPAVLQGSLA